MGYLAKSLSPDQEIVVQLTTTADRDEVGRRLSLDGIRLKVLSMEKPGMVKIGVTAPAGLSPVRRDGVAATREGSVGRLALTRSVGGEIIVRLREGADVAVALDWLASEGLAFQVAAIRATQSLIHVTAINELLILRDELCLA